MSEIEFFDLCVKHDWYYPFADDHKAWLKGNEEHKELMRLLPSNPAFLEIYEQWLAYVQNRGPRPVLCALLEKQAV